MISESNDTYDFGLVLPDKYQKEIYLFDDTPPSINDGLNGTFQEKIRRFNVSVGFLVNRIGIIETTAVEEKPIVQSCRDEPCNIDIIYRRMIRDVYMELFIYQEKLLNIVCNLFFVRICKTREQNLRKLKKRSAYFPQLMVFCEECRKLKDDERYQRVMAIRDDEIHNMSQLDSFIYDIHKEKDDVKIVNKGYKIKATTLREDYLYAMDKLLYIRNIVQDILNESDFMKIKRILDEKGEETWVN